MRILCLFFPRLGVQLVQRGDPARVACPLALLSGEGEDAVVVAASTPAVTPGMMASQARRRCPGIRFLPDNAGARYDELARLASIIRTNATPLVAIGGSDHLFIDIRGLEPRFGDEAGVARRVTGMAQAWTGLRVRAAVAGSRAEALAAARGARHGPVCIPPSGHVATSEPPVTWDPGAVLAAEITLDPCLSASRRRARMLRVVTKLSALARGRGEAPRTVVVRLDVRAGPSWRATPPSAPLATDVELAAAVGCLVEDELEAATAVRIELRDLVPPAEAPGLPIVSERMAPAPQRRARQLMLAAG